MMNPVLSSGHRSTCDFYFYHGFNGAEPLELLEPLNLLNPLNLFLGVRQKPEKPLALDARCLLRAIDSVPV